SRQNEAATGAGCFAKTKPILVLGCLCKTKPTPDRRCSTKRSHLGSPPLCLQNEPNFLCVCKTNPTSWGWARGDFPHRGFLRNEPIQSLWVGVLDETKPIVRSRCPLQNEANVGAHLCVWQNEPNLLGDGVL